MHAGLPYLQEKAISFLHTHALGNNCPNGLYQPPRPCTVQVCEQSLAAGLIPVGGGHGSSITMGEGMGDPSSLQQWEEQRGSGAGPGR